MSRLLCQARTESEEAMLPAAHAFSEIHPTLGFTEFDILEQYRKSSHKSELGSFHSVFPFKSIAQEIGLSEQRPGRRNSFSLSAKIALMVLKAYT